RGNKILIVDDNPVNIALISEQFNDNGFYNLLSAANGKDAVDMALQHAPDLILMDIQMPVMDGNEAITRLISMDYNGALIALSAFAMKEDIDHTLRLGAKDYITKPINFDTFFKRLAVFLEDKPA
ncbi:MAG: response regulator, partial [bacterium]|nr:response regulator [bacterium]